MVPFDWKDFIARTTASVEHGEIPMARVDDAVTRILRVKMRAGLFRVVDGRTVSIPPSQRAGAQDERRRAPARARAPGGARIAGAAEERPPHAAAARHPKRVLVVGRAADSIADQSGGWSLTWQGTNTTNADFPVADSILEGVRNQVGTANVTYSADAAGVDVRSYDAVIAVIGESPYAEGGGDIRRSGTLEHARRHPEDRAVLDRVAGQGVPVVTVLLSGRPLWVNPEINRSDAFVAAWLPGTEGQGVTDVLFHHGDSYDDFRGRLSFSWPRTACQTPLNKGDKDYQPQFAVGYGLTYDAPHADLGKLDESPQPERCGPPVPAASEDLVLFQQVVNPAYRLVIGSPANWRLPIGDDLNAVVTTSDGHVKAETAQLNGQQDARRITFTGDGQFAVDSLKMVDLAGWQKAGATLAFDIAIDQAPAGNVHVRVDCGHPCGGQIDVTAGLRALPLHAKTTLRLPLKCFAEHGADMAAVDTPFGLDTDKPFVATIANVRWEVGAAKSGGRAGVHAGEAARIGDRTPRRCRRGLAPPCIAPCSCRQLTH